eukprot:Platyproteum_vivax@DN2550_c0_g1_i1.p1
MVSISKSNMTESTRTSSSTSSRRMARISGVKHVLALLAVSVVVVCMQVEVSSARRHGHRMIKGAVNQGIEYSKWFLNSVNPQSNDSDNSKGPSFGESFSSLKQYGDDYNVELPTRGLRRDAVDGIHFEVTKNNAEELAKKSYFLLASEFNRLLNEWKKSSDEGRKKAMERKGVMVHNGAGQAQERLALYKQNILPPLPNTTKAPPSMNDKDRGPLTAALLAERRVLTELRRSAGLMESTQR